MQAWRASVCVCVCACINGYGLCAHTCGEDGVWVWLGGLILAHSRLHREKVALTKQLVCKAANSGLHGPFSFFNLTA